MSFSKQVKAELTKTEYENVCCERSLLYGMCLFGKSFRPFGIGIQTENINIAKLYSSLMKKHCNVKCTIKTSPKGKSHSIMLTSKSDCDKIMGAFGHDSGSSLKINHSNFTCENCAKAFLTGVFLTCGTLSDPQKDYHMEFIVSYLNLSKSLVTLLSELDLNAKTTNRKGYHIIYFKDSEAIEDCLYIMGAPSSMFEMMNVEIVKEIRNKANRTANCEAANIEKTVRASYEHLEAITKIKKKKGLDFLNSDLRDIAVLRLENPEASLAELSRMSGLSRSGVNHRLKRIVEIASEL